MTISFNEFLATLPDGRHRVDELKAEYQEHFGTKPEVVASAPGRTEIIGNHTDHNNGRVVAAAITLDTLVVAGPSSPGESGPDTVMRLISSGWDREFVATPGTADHDTEKLMLGIREGLLKQDLPAPGYQAFMASSVLPGSGLSSSAALEVALAGVHATLSGSEISPLQAARAGQYAENHFMKKPSGLMDQYASALGGMQAIDFADPRAPRVHEIEIDFSESNHRLMVVNTGGSHADLTDAYGEISREMHAVAEALGARTLAETDRRKLLANLTAVRRTIGDRAVLRALHFFEEQDRVLSFADAADSRLNHDILELMTESGDSSIRLLQNVHTGSATDQSLALGIELTRTYLRQRGAVGACRVHGGGFAGSMLVAIPEDLVHEYRVAMHRAFGEDSVIPLEIRRQGLISAKLPV